MMEDIEDKGDGKNIFKKIRTHLRIMDMFSSRDIHLHRRRLRKAKRFYLLVFRVWLCQANKKPERGKRIYGECTRVIMMMGHETDA